MTPADEAQFIALWQQGASQQELAARLGVPVGTIKSRASALARQGKIQPRPKGGAYPRQRALARSSAEGPPSTVHPGTVDGPPSHRPPSTMDATTAGNTLRWYEDLEDELVAFLKGVPPQGNNRKVWSPKLATILVEACTLTESVFYHITPTTAAVGDRDRDHMGLAEYAELYAVSRQLAERKVVFFQEPLNWVHPFKRWVGRTGDFKAPPWWNLYNRAKHQRLETLDKATLDIAILAVAGAFVTIVTTPALLLAALRHEWLNTFSYDRPEYLVKEVLEQRSGMWLCPETPLFAALLGSSPLPDDINELKDPGSPITITSPRLVRWLGLW